MNGVGSLLLLIGLAFTLGFLFSGMEAGVLALNRLRIRQMARSGNAAARRLNEFLERPEDFLWTILIGNTLANFVLVVLVFLALHTWLGERPLWLALAVGGAVILVYGLGELLPKMLFRRFPNQLCLLLARPFSLARLALSPGVGATAWLARWLVRLTGGQQFTGDLFGNRDELRQLMQESASTLSAEERRMINRVLDLQTATVGAIAVSLTKVPTLRRTTPAAEILRLCRERELTRLPVLEEGTGRVLGIVNLPSLLYRAELDPAQTAAEFLASALYFDESMRLEQALERLRHTGQRLAIVRDREGREVGIITLEDILRFIFGEVAL